MSWCLALSYESEKQLGILKALVADLEAKNRVLELKATASDNKCAGLEEQRSIQEDTSKAKIKELTSVIATHVRQVNLTYLLNEDLKTEKKTQRETYDVYINDIQDKLDTQKDVFEGVVAENGLLTEQVDRLREEGKDLKAQVRELRYRASVMVKLEKVLTSFE